MMLCSMYTIKPGSWDQDPGFSVYDERAGGGGKPAKNLLTPPPGKKVSLLPGKILPVDSPHNQTTIFFRQASKPKPLNWYRHVQKQHWRWAITMNRGLGTKPEQSRKSSDLAILPILANSPS